MRAESCVSASHESDGRASLSPASRVGRVPVTSSGSPGRTRPTGFMARVQVLWNRTLPTNRQ
ncbi:MAG: hypothetical protein FJ398_09010 [Verrucomicrobia bacterium]|nr:hypothetical protein [Verrucomicrobiota bacterium]